MTQDEWNAATNVRPMLTFLRSSDRASERKLRLFAVACCRRLWNLLTDGRSRLAVEIAEKFADGAKEESCLSAAQVKAAKAYREQMGRANWAAASTCNRDAWNAARNAIQGTMATYLHANYDDRPHVWVEVPGIPRSAQAGILRCIVNPFYPAASLDPSFLTPELLGLAHSIYETRATNRFPELAAALEAAGCTDAELLNHLRCLGPHAGRGCWALDAILGQN